MTALLHEFPDPRVNAALSTFVEALRGFFGGRLVSVSVYGSLVFDDLAPGYGDLDFLAVIEDDLTEDDRRRLADLRKPFRSAEADVCSRMIEGAFLPRAMLDPAVRGRGFWWGTSGERPWETNQLGPLVLHVIRERGGTLWGRDIRDEIPQPSRADLLGEIWHACESMAGRGGDGGLHSIEWLLMAARLILYLREGRLSSKGEAADWGAANVKGAWRDLLPRAKALRLNPADAAAPEAQTWLRGLAAPIDEARHELYGALIDAGFRPPPVKMDLTADQARRLLARLGDVEVLQVERIATTNHVFKATTASHGTFFLKFHTARWYLDHLDAFFVAEREAAVCEFLVRRGMPLPYPAWADTSKSVVPRSVFVTGELAGAPVTEALAAAPREADDILRALGRYFRRLHAIEFTNPGFLGPEHARVAPSAGRVPYVEAWDQMGMHRPEHFQSGVLQQVAQVAATGRLPAGVPEALEALFRTSAATLAPDYHPPRFTVGNCHAWHFHAARAAAGWEVLGFYDFEAVSAGDAATDLVELEFTLTPALRSLRWRDPFFEGYGRRPALDGYRLRVLHFLLGFVTRDWGGAIPDHAWLAGRWMHLIQARDWDEFVWYPPGIGERNGG